MPSFLHYLITVQWLAITYLKSSGNYQQMWQAAQLLSQQLVCLVITLSSLMFQPKLPRVRRMYFGTWETGWRKPISPSPSTEQVGKRAVLGYWLYYYLAVSAWQGYPLRLFVYKMGTKVLLLTSWVVQRFQYGWQWMLNFKVLCN